MTRVLFSLLIAFSLSSVIAQKPDRPDEAALRSIPQSFVTAWNHHDGHELAKIMAPDVDFVNVGADWLQGRDNFEAYHTRLLSGRFNTSTLVALDTQVRFLGRDLAVIHWSWRIQGDLNEDHTARKHRYGLFTMIARREGAGWLVVEAQNSNQIPGPNPELNGIKPPITFPADTHTP